MCVQRLTFRVFVLKDDKRAKTKCSFITKHLVSYILRLRCMENERQSHVGNSVCFI